MNELMTEAQTDLVRTTWALVRPRFHVFFDAMYEEFFDAEPQLRLLFDVDMDVQHYKLARLFDRTIEQIDSMDSFAGDLRMLGKRHDAMGVKPRHYVALGEAMWLALDRVLGNDLTPEALHAWKHFYAVLCEAMLQDGSDR